MDTIDKKLLNILQFSFPLTTEPWQSIAAELSLSEGEVLQRISHLKELGIVRQISPIFASKNIGYHSTLAAFAVPESRIEEVAQHVSTHRGVSHNYLRNNCINLWFTVTVPKDVPLESEVQRIAQECGITKWFYLPSEKTYNIGFTLNMNKDARLSSSIQKETNKKPDLPYDTSFIATVQEDLPLVTNPYKAIAETLSMTEEAVVDQLERYISAGYIRRVAAVLRPTKAGFTHNVMVGWETADNAASDALGIFAASLEPVSHSYRRQKHVDWPISVYTMIHGQSQADIEAVIAEIRAAHNPRSVIPLKTLREFKKERVLYYLS